MSEIARRRRGLSAACPLSIICPPAFRLQMNGSVHKIFSFMLLSSLFEVVP